MKPKIHPNYVEASVICACGETFKTRSTKPMIRVDVCSKCHPLFTGKEKLVDTEGRVERFQKRAEKGTAARAKKTVVAVVAKKEKEKE